MMKKESAASIRARERGYFQAPTWYCDIVEEPVTGLGPEQGVHRRDPSSVLLYKGKYYVWYSKSYGPHVGFGTGDDFAKVFPWDYCDLYYATSEDGSVWQEQGIAVRRGEDGAYDDRSVFTPEVIAVDGRYCLVYQVVSHPYRLRSPESIAMATADTPDGPWQKTEAPILSPLLDGVWKGEEDNRFLVARKSSFDGLKTHDPCLLKYHHQYYLYYKGEPMGEELYMGGRETKWGVAISDTLLGPYVRSEYNPISNSGHETCLWLYRDGVAALLTTDGMERNTFQFAPDGINFEITGAIKGAPEAMGPFRPSEPSDRSPLDGLRWGLCHHVNTQWNYIAKFSVDERFKDMYINKRTNK